MSEDEMVEFITSAYGGDLACPDFSFVRAQLAARPYDSAIERIRALDALEVAESIDLNYEVCFGYEMVGETSIWVLEISMVAPLAVLARAGGGYWHQLIYPSGEGLTSVEEAVFDILGAQGIEFPSREQLEQPLDMSLAFTDPENVRVYHALFSDEDFLPWQFSPLYPELSRSE
ncbi:hypothetical protein FHR81_002739 [Actinoalloteichus hoggarensis]|nr:hypothetical protein [Actinoalloteichus hoggarensis]MBB5921699.1 hypothetical protein [Actinoalloteichus hoggarensis]